MMPATRDAIYPRTRRAVGWELAYYALMGLVFAPFILVREILDLDSSSGFDSWFLITALALCVMKSAWEVVSLTRMLRNSSRNEMVNDTRPAWRGGSRTENSRLEAVVDKVLGVVLVGAMLLRHL